jgi:peptidoglycan/xylan/chitin deacetylase (PgdA/CDA1 family)
MPSTEQAVYLTFDDGPHPEITPWVLDQLKKWEFRSSFFCVGDRARQYPEIIARILSDGHTVGNHTYSHLNGWKTSDKEYLEDIQKAREWIPSGLYRPPYGKMRPSQQKKLLGSSADTIVMWSLLSGDFDNRLSGEQCMRNVLSTIRSGDIVVFHDSEKAWDRLEYCLPKILAHIKERGWRGKSLEYR